MICQIIGYEHNKNVDESILGLFWLFSPPESIACTKFDYVQFLVGVINFQLSKFNYTKSFRYQAHLVYLILFNNSSSFESLEN